MKLLTILTLVWVCACNSHTKPLKISTLTVNDPAYRLNFIVYSGETKLSPLLLRQFEKAVATWNSVLNIEAAIYMTNTSRRSAPFLESFEFEDLDAIRVRFVDVQGPSFERGANVLGFWQPKDHLLCLDQDSLFEDPEMAYRVALHEIGHVIGLPHITNQGGNTTLTGMLVSNKELDAKLCVMYPTCIEKYKNFPLSDIEIKLAKQYVTFMGAQGLQNNICLFYKLER